MPFNSSGTLVTDKRDIAISESWDSQTEWESYQSATGIEVTNGVIKLSDDPIPPGTIDDFESYLYEDAGNTLSYYYAGDLNSFERQQSVVQSGSYALQPTSGSSILNDSGGNFNLSTGSTFEFYQRNTSGSSDGGWIWFCQNEGTRSNRTCYEAKVRSNNNDMRIGLVENGSTTVIQDTGISVPTDEWMRGVVTHTTNGDITFDLYDSSGTLIDSVSGNDTTFTSGGHGFECFNADLYWDSVREVNP